MSDNTDDDVAVSPAEAAAEAAAIAAAMEGYQARAKAPAVEPDDAAPAVPAAATGDDGADHANTPADPPQPPEVPNLLDDDPADALAPEPATVEGIAAQMKELKEAVKSASGDPEAIRKLFGEIGNINRTLQQLAKPQAAPTAKADPAPADDELAAALKEVDGAADAFPEVGGPLANALKAVAKRATATAAPSLSAQEISALVAKEAAAQVERAARDALMEEHPDFEEVNKTPAFQKWLAAQPEEYRTRLSTTWSAAVVAKGLTDFKTELARQQDARKQKQDRLAGAVTPPRSGNGQFKPSKLSDEEAALAGYNSVRRLNSPTNHKR